MNWVGLIFLVLRYLPTVISLVKEIIGAIDSIKDKQIKAQAALELKEAVKQARKRGDRKPLRNLLNKLVALREQQ